MAKFVLEIGTEEVPARFLPVEEDALRELFSTALADAALPFSSMQVMATPRRLALIVDGLPEIQPEGEELVIGPPVSCAYNKNGEATRALSGFAASSGVAIEDVFRHQTDKGEYVACRRKTGGLPTVDVLAGICPIILEKLPFAKSMRWGANHVSYARPLRWILALFDDKAVPFHVGPVQSGNEIYGHRVHGPGSFVVCSAQDYEKIVAEKCAVTLNPTERRRQIVEGGNALAAADDSKILWNDKLLDEVCGLVEHPRPLIADFDPSFLEIPDVVLLTSMQSHQKSFGVADASGKLKPHFLTVLNFDPKDMGLVKRGWERVLRARLEDARFFWRTDTNDKMENWLKKLDSVIFIGPLGSMGDKSRRLAALCQELTQILSPEDLTPEQAYRAGLLAKADLVSTMVGEFDTLQGIMGGIYAERAGEDASVARAIGEQYLPAGPDTPIPATAGGCILSLADKTDTLAGCFGLNMIPTGAADPNGLRRCALGIIRILLGRNWYLNVETICQKARQLYGDVKWKLNEEESGKKLAEFFSGRLRNYFIAQGYETNYVEAALAAGSTIPADAQARLDALVAFSKRQDFADSVQTLKRVENITKKAAMQDNSAWDANLLNEQADRDLADAITKILPELDKRVNERDYAGALAKLGDLRQPVDNFFDKVLVLCEDEALRANRLKMLQTINGRFAGIAQFSCLQI